MIDAYVPIFFVPILLFTLYSGGKDKIKYNIFVAALLALIMFLYGQREINTTIGNYIELGYYLFVLFAAKALKPTNFWHGIINIILLLNITLLILYPAANIHYTNELHFDSLGYPGFLKHTLLTTIPAFILTLFVLKRNEWSQIMLLIVYLLLASKTTNLILVIVFLMFNFTNPILFVLISTPMVILMNEYIGFSEYLMDRINRVINFDISSDEFARIPLMYNSILSFFRNPFFGIGYFKINFEDIRQLLKYPIGHHSHLFDNLGRFGFLWLFVLRREIKMYWSASSSFLILGLAWSILNNLISLGSGLALFILLNYENDSNRLEPR